MGKFKKGLFLGGLLGASMVWLNTTKKGREVKVKLLDQAADIYLDLKDRVMQSETMEKLSKQDFVVMVRDAVDKYAVQNGLSDKVKKMVTKLISTQWNNLQKELQKRVKPPESTSSNP